VNVDHKKAVANFIKAATKGVIKVASKIGISTMQSYRGAQIFEAVGLSQSVVDKYFTWTATRVEGSDIKVIAEEASSAISAASRTAIRRCMRSTWAVTTSGVKKVKPTFSTRSRSTRCKRPSARAITTPSSNTARW
jgi:glutamate synthase domain-containing protein 2